MQELKTKLDEAWKAEMPFVAYHLPDDKEVKCIMPKDSKLRYLQRYDEAGFILSPFEISSQPIVFLEANSTVYKFKLIDNESASKGKFSINEQDKQAYLDLLDKTISYINAGEAKKIVLSRVISFDYQLDSPSDLLMKLIQSYPKAFTYVWYHPEVGFWAGATPETFAKTYRNRLDTMALAGTKRGDESRAWTEKEKTEQQIVTDDISSTLTKYAEKVEISERKTDHAGELLHLRTDIVARYKSSQLGEILNALHPTPAVCGLPKEKAYRFLLANENYDRQFYTGFLGELNRPKQTQRSSRTRNQENQAYKSIARVSNLFVNLRCLSYARGKVNIYVGGGITKDSNPLDEWEETQNKSRTMLKVL